LTLVKDDYGAEMHYEYDCLGNMTLEDRLVEEGIWHRIRYAYNKNGWRVRKTEHIQDNGETNRAVTSYGYDMDGNLTSVNMPKGVKIRMKYDADGCVTEEHVLDKKTASTW